MLQVSTIFVEYRFSTCEAKGPLKDKVKKFSRRGDISAIGDNIVKAYKEGRLKEKAGLVNILDTISQNLCTKKIGKDTALLQKTSTRSC